MKNFFRKQFLPLILAVMMTVTTMPFSVFANRSEDPAIDHINLNELDFETLEDEDILNNIEDRVSDDLLIDFSADLSVEELMDKDLFFYLEPDEQVFAETTLDDTFEDDAVIIVLNRISSRDDEDFTVEDFGNIGALYIEDLDRLSDYEYEYAEELWEAERDIVLAENFYAFYADLEEELEELHEAYLDIREDAEENTLVNFDEFRRSMLIRLDQNCRENVLDIIQQLQERDDIYWVGPSYIYESESVITNNSLSSLQWSVNRISLTQAHRITTGVRSIRVGILGSRIDANHPDLRGRVRADLGGIFYNDGGGSSAARYTWGTQQAGIIGGTRNNNRGIVGMAPNVEFIPLRAVNSNGGMPNGAAINAINHARQRGIPIISRSFGVTTSDTAFFNSVRNYTGLFVNAAGNGTNNNGIGINTNNNPLLPGLSNVLIVGASNQNDARRPYSNFGSTSVHLFAPSGVQTTAPNNSFDSYGGTSAATPHVAGVAALVLSLNPNLTSQQLRSIILDSVDPVPGLANISVSGGRLNAYNAVRRVIFSNNLTARTTRANVPIRPRPYSASGVTRRIANNNSAVSINGFTINSADNVWFRLTSGEWVFSGNVSFSTTVSINTRTLRTTRTNVPVRPSAAASSGELRRIANNNSNVSINGFTMNSAGNVWFRVVGGGWIYSGNLRF